MRVPRNGRVAASWKVFVVSAALALAAAISVLPARAASAQSTGITIELPASGATLSGSQWFDAFPNGSGDTGVQFLLVGANPTTSCTALTGGSCLVGNATLSWVGWVVNFNTENVPNGNYDLTATVQPGNVTTVIPVTVSNPPPTIEVPTNNSIVSGFQWFDCDPPPTVTQVVIVLLGPTGVPFNGTANLSWVGWVADIGNFMSGTWSASCSATYPEGGIGVGPTISFFVP